VAASLADLLGASGAGATQGGGAKGAGGGGGAAAAVALQEGLVLPDARGVLRPAVELSYNDAPWLDDAPGAAGADIAGEE
jgi:hypothetical protein